MITNNYNDHIFFVSVFPWAVYCFTGEINLSCRPQLWKNTMPISGGILFVMKQNDVTARLLRAVCMFPIGDSLNIKRLFLQ